MIDPINLVFVDNLQKLVVQRFGRFEVGAEGFSTTNRCHAPPSSLSNPVRPSSRAIGANASVGSPDRTGDCRRSPGLLQVSQALAHPVERAGSFGSAAMQVTIPHRSAIAVHAMPNEAIRDSLMNCANRARRIACARSPRCGISSPALPPIRKTPPRSTGCASGFEKLEANRATGGNRLFYLATPPDAFAPIARELGRTGLLKEDGGAWQRLVVEKPFGTDLESAKA